ncbi:TPA: hypothetical protein ACQ3CU_005435 [Klebsiella pneumoniae]|nr:hypothetical protein [Enterobacter hormaechei]
MMLGVIRDPQNAAGTASVTDAATTKAVLANTQVTSSKNKLTIGAENSVADDHIAVSNGFGAANYALRATMHRQLKSSVIRR